MLYYHTSLIHIIPNNLELVKNFNYSWNKKNFNIWNLFQFYRFNRSTLNGGYSNAVKKSILLINANNSGSELAERRHLHHHTSVDSGFRTSTDSEYR